MSDAINDKRPSAKTLHMDQTVAGTIAPLREIIAIWRPYRGRLLLGGLLSLCALASGLMLMGAAGGRLAGAAIGLSVAYIAVRLAGIGRIVLRYVERLFTHDAMFRALAAVRVWFYRKLATSSAAGLGFRRSGDLLSRLVSDIETLDSLYLRLAIPLAGAVLAGPVVSVIGWRTEHGLGLGLAVLFALSAFAFPAIAAYVARRNGAALSQAEVDLRIAALDFSGGLREARAFEAEAQLVDRIEARQEQLYTFQQQQSRRLAIAGASSFLCSQIAILLALGAISVWGSVHVDLLQATILLFIVIAVFEGTMGLTRAGLTFAQVSHAALRVSEVARSQQHAGTTAVIPAMRGDIVLNDISFRWADDRRPVFKNMTLTIRCGERVALLGPSGSGKSSLAALLLKVVTPDSGSIVFAGDDIAGLDTDQWRKRIAWLSQSTHLFDDTIRNNLLLVRPEATDEALWHALDQARIGDFVRALPDGLDAWIGEGGSRLSGGQGRRIALARTLLSDAPILILDEPATGLDADTERDFLRTLNETTTGRTVLLIAHRLTGIEKLDRVWRLQDGQAVAMPL
ncbi:transport ATP-binding protein CydD [Neoasaia chiangmaiensis NBRC 101099]|nr:transport ATP-binding protein CydD [Neoasaia chiangmaiensis NBRC 101099]GEN15065.1 cysteine/glutathione ABC transporter ATP-binding protein/permease CydC [Neoasaia chiangmaiensis]